MRRIAQVIDLAEGAVAEYEQLHAAVWPSVLAQIRRSGIRNYSIYRNGLTLFAYFEYGGEDFEADMAAMAKDPETQRWWSLCMPLQRPSAERPAGTWWSDLPELFHSD